MSKLKHKNQKILIYVIYLAMIFSITYLIANVINLDLNLSCQVILVIAFSSIAKIFIVYPVIFLMGLVLIAWGSFFLVKYRPFIFLSIQEKVLVLYFNISANLSGRQTILEENKILIYFLILALISLFTAFIVYRLKRIYFLIPVYLLIFLTYWYSFVDESYILTAVFIFLFLVLFGLKKYNSKQKPVGKNFNSWARASIVYSVLIVSLAFFIPKTNNFLSWPLLEDKVYDVFPMVEDLRYYKDSHRKSSNASSFQFSRSGFSDGDSVLGGPFVQSERKIMTVETDSPLYLRGNVQHIYTGKSWRSMSFPRRDYSLNEDLSYLFDREKESFYVEKSATINFDSFSSKTIFAPYKAEKIITDKNFYLTIDNDHILTSTDAIYRKESYIVEYLKPLPYDVSVGKGMNRRANELVGLDLYLQLPQEDLYFSEDTYMLISDRTIDLTKAIVKDINKDYEKALAIQNYLKNNYEYKLDVEKLPEDKEFVDYFLFEKKEGYCTYYATAMAVMLRLEGIPARYVEGYIVDEKIGSNNYQVRQKHAHAWVEAFIEPVGWVSFEPTAAYDNSVNSIEDKKEIETDVMEELPVEDTEPGLPIELPEAPKDDSPAKTDISENDNLIKIALIFIFLVFLLFLIGRISMNFLKYKNKSKHLKSFSNRDKFVYIYKDIIDLLDLLGFSKYLGETPFEYANRISISSSDLKIQEIKNITSLFVEIKYSNREAEDEDIFKILKYKEDLDEKLKAHLGRIGYLYRKYISFHIKNIKEIP